MIRFFDVFLSFTILIITFPIFIFIFLIGLLDSGSPIFIQERIGRYQITFNLIKFRTMKVGTASVASHLASAATVTKFGTFLRRTKMDELPQLINVLRGEMSLVGPRPNLTNQTELIEFRKKFGVYNNLPGITGLAQIQNIDMSTPELLANTDKQMIESLTLGKYFSYIFKTVLGNGRGDAVNR